MRKPVVTKHRLRGPSKEADILRDQAVAMAVTDMLEAMAARLEGHKPEFVIAALHGVTIKVAQWSAARGSASRVIGSLGKASAVVSPAYEPKGKGPTAEAEALFKGAAG